MNYDGRPIVLPFHVALTMHGETLDRADRGRGQRTFAVPRCGHPPIVGLQRLAAFSEAIEADTAAAIERGMERFADGIDATGQRYVYFRSVGAPGVILELLEVTPFFADFVGRLEARVHSYAEKTRASASRADAAPLQKLGASRRMSSAATGDPTVANERGEMKAAQLGDYGDPNGFQIAFECSPSRYPDPARCASESRPSP